MNGDQPPNAVGMFCYHGKWYALSLSVLMIGQRLWEGLSSERGPELAESILRERLDAAGATFGVPVEAPPSVEVVSENQDSGRVLVSSMAALVVAGFDSRPASRS